MDSLFTNKDGVSTKFFIQKNLPPEVDADVQRKIEASGGRIEVKVPRAGYVLIDPGTAEADRLQNCWRSADRPERHFVPYTFVEDCQKRNTVIKQVFCRETKPIPFHIHSSISKNMTEIVTRRILNSGGDPFASEKEAEFIIVNPNSDDFQEVVQSYQLQPNKRVEPYQWLKGCVEAGTLDYSPVVYVYKNPGGRRPGQPRTDFTEADERHLCEWIASRLPFKGTGGRTGNKIYQELCDLGDKEGYSWAKRHSWQSWRERYKKHIERLDPMIEAIVNKTEPEPGAPPQYAFVREEVEKPRRLRRKRRVAKKEPSPPPASEEPPQPAPPQSSQNSSHPRSNDENESPRKDGVPSTSKAKEYIDNDSEWAIRIGDAEPPPWSKRKAEIDIARSQGKRRRRNGDVSSGTDISVDTTIEEVAKQFQFTFDEVKLYHDKCQDTEKTKARFKKMRERLDALSETE